jgi:hypothetical protein
VGCHGIAEVLSSVSPFKKRLGIPALEYTDIPKVFFSPHHAGSITVVFMLSEVIVAQQCVPKITSVLIVAQ